MGARLPKLRPWMLKREIILLYYGLRDKRTSAIPKMTALLAIIYLLSPIDLIPDFIPFFGYIDDVVVVPILLNLATRLLPREVREESLLKASRSHKKLRGLFIFMLVLLLALIIGLFFLMRHMMNNR
jgi:uncharacterized membrane protein YkvA (DUF1232 family)